MSVLYILVPLALSLVSFAVLAFLWAAKRGQMDDLSTPAVRILYDETSGHGRSDDSTESVPSP
jgi:cbb3-type cytochrome oxidase maturation protein